MNLDDSVGLLGAMADPTRLRLMAALEGEELTVAELQRILDLPQSRVSTHLGRLREAGLALDRVEGTYRYYRLANGSVPEPARTAWPLLREKLEADPQLVNDRQRRKRVLASREKSWLDRVAGSMERHYSPGRTWESLARGLALLPRLGRVADLGAGDAAIAELLAPAAEMVIAVELSATMVGAAQERLVRSKLSNVIPLRADMHRLPIATGTMDCVLLSQSLQYAEEPGQVVREIGRILKRNGRALILTLAAHRHSEIREEYGHLHLGFRTQQLKSWLNAAGLTIDHIGPAGRERRAPQFESMAVLATRKENN